MQITIQNDALALTVDTLGAQMMSLQANGIEYLWQGDPPILGRPRADAVSVHWTPDE